MPEIRPHRDAAFRGIAEGGGDAGIGDGDDDVGIDGLFAREQAAHQFAILLDGTAEDDGIGP